MSCACNKKTIVYKNQKIEIEERFNKPFDSCVQCARKHISLALILTNKGIKDRGAINVFLCYKHLEKKYTELAKTVFDLYERLIKEKANENDIKILVKFFMREYHKVNENQNETTLNLEYSLDEDLRKKTYLLSAYEMLFEEFGYNEINQPYVIGYLQLACELEQDELTKQVIRSIWKNLDKNTFEKLLKEYKLL